jgi:16S rRNA U516 pseudouridylate synthase RsuA-like enzyme
VNKYLAFKRPFEVLTEFNDHSGRKTLMDFIPIEGIYVSGRLDYRSERLLILSNDEPMIQHLTRPHYCQPKAYLAHMDVRLTKEAIKKLIIELGSLEPGELRFLTNGEILQLKQELDFGNKGKIKS